MIDVANVLVNGVWLWTSIAGLAIGTLAFAAASRGNGMAPILVMLTVPLQRTVLVGDGELRFTWTQIALAGFFAGATLLLCRGGLRVPLDLVTVASFAMASAYCLSILVSDEPSTWAGATYRWAVALVFLAVARPYAAKLNAGRSLAVAMSTMALAMLATGVAQAIGAFGPSSFERSGLTRAYGAFGEPNPFGAFVVMVTLPCLALALQDGRWRRRNMSRLATVAGLAGIVAIVASQSRGAALGLATGLVALAIISWAARGYRCHRLVISVAGSVAILFVLASPMVVGEFVSGDEVTSANWSERERQAHWGAATRMLLDHPVLGVGAGGFDDQFREYTTEWRFRISQGHAHNAYLQVAAETGVIGLVAYFALLGAVSWRLLERVTGFPGSWRSWGALAVTAAIAVHGVFDYLHVLSLGIVLSGIWAYGLAEAPRGVAPGEHNPPF